MFQGTVWEVGEVALSSVRQRLLVLRPLHLERNDIEDHTVKEPGLVPDLKTKFDLFIYLLYWFLTLNPSLLLLLSNLTVV